VLLSNESGCITHAEGRNRKFELGAPGIIFFLLNSLFREIAGTFPPLVVSPTSDCCDPYLY
ncbi:MAG: hypothetical protein ACJ70W_05550, partial [Nitrososphaera sp.]